jgi:hypothetical protein
MDLYIDNLFKPTISKENKKCNDLTKNYINILNNSIKKRNGKVVTSRELNKIYQIGGYSNLYNPISANPELSNINYDQYGINRIEKVAPLTTDCIGCVASSTEQSPGASSAQSPGASSVQSPGASSGQSSVLSNIKPTTISLSKMDSIIFSDTNSSPAETQGLNSSTCAGSSTQCSGSSCMAYSYSMPKTPTSSVAKIISSISDMFNSESATVPKQKMAVACGGGKKIYSISLTEFNDIMNKHALFKMPKHHRIEFKNFLEYKINQ